MKTYAFDLEELEALARAEVEAHGDAGEANIRLVFTGGDFWTTGEVCDVKCTACMEDTSRLFVHALDREMAKLMLFSGTGGMCGDCYASMLAMP